MGRDLNFGAGVVTAEGQVFGQLVAVVLTSDLGRFTHLVARRGLIFPAYRVVPTDYVGEIAGRTVTLMLTARQVADLSPLESEAWVPLEVSDQSGDGLGPLAGDNIWGSPVRVALPRFVMAGNNVQPYVAEQWRNLPEGSLVLRSGLPVRARDGRVVGGLVGLVVGPAAIEVAAIVVRGDAGLGRGKAIPIDWIEGVDEKTGIRLATAREAVAELPDHR